MPIVNSRAYRLPAGVAPRPEHIQQNTEWSHFFDMMASTGETYCDSYENETNKLDAYLAVPMAPPIGTVSGSFTTTHEFTGPMPDDINGDSYSYREQLDEIRYGNRIVDGKTKYQRLIEKLEADGMTIISGEFNRPYVSIVSRRASSRANAEARASGTDDRYLRF
jgi:hypothetical protein